MLSKLQQLRTMHLFAGAGGGILADIMLGHRPVCAVEWEPYCQQVIIARQRDGSLSRFPVFGDIREFDGTAWRGIVDVICGGFPCQDLSSSGSKLGLSGERSGLWFEMLRVIGEVRPKFVFVENSPNIITNGIGTVLGGLSALGYGARWGIVEASQAGAPHVRERFWLVAHSDGVRQQGQRKCLKPEHSAEDRYREAGGIVNAFREGALPYVCRGHDGMASGMDRLKALGNGQDPGAAALAWRILSEGL